MTGKPVLNARVSGELFIITLEVASLYLQRDEHGLRKKLDELSEPELNVIRTHLANLTCYLRDVAEREVAA